MATLTAGLAGFVGLWAMFEHRPGWYRPGQADDATARRAQVSAAEFVDSISDQLAGSQGIELIVNASEANDWIASLPRLWPEAARSLPPELSNLAIGFRPGAVHVGGYYTGDGWHSILNVTIALELCNEGSTLIVRLTDVHSGALPIPRAALAKVFGKLVGKASDASGLDAWNPLAPSARRQRELIPEPSPGRPAEQRPSGGLAGLRSVDQLFEGIRIDNRFIWPNGDRPCRISSLRISPGELRIGLEPL
ncbi:MAG: hypothetical protein ACE5HE_04155 [Phycisphaerae bacterium]